MSADFNDIDIIQALKSELHTQILSTIEPNLSKYHKIALFLFSPTNKLVQFSSTEKEAVIHDCKIIMEDFIKDNVCNTTEISVANDEFADYIEKQQIDPNNNQVKQELQGYTSINVPYSTNFDALAWWDMHQNFFPLLHKTSCKIFCIPASSAASERTFSNARNLITERPCLIAANSENINKIMFLHSNVN